LGWRILGCHCARKYLPRNARVRQAFTISDESVGSRTDSPNVGITRFHGAAVATRTNGLMTPVQSHAGETSSLSGDLNSDPNVRAAAAQDFGHLIYKQPRAVFRPAARPGIASLLRYAKQQGLKVAARGQGQSIYGRALADDGIVIDMTTVNTIHNVEPDRIVVEAGVTWGCTTGSSIAHPAK